MKFSRSELSKKGIEPFDFEESVTFPPEAFTSLSGLRGLKDVRVFGNAQFYVNEERLLVNFTVEGTMILPCALTNVDVDYPFSEEREVIFSFMKEKDVDDDIIEAKKGIADLMPVVFETIICEVPLKVVSPNAEIKRKGNGWELISDEDLANQTEEFDPRLAKLRELLKNEDE
ncbi:MAG: DUF177 domain-containing protein [Erysipelotrichales bacterium]|nr:DUF177 domain-containing protein [Erysipelotrichales bacterium]